MENCQNGARDKCADENAGLKGKKLSESQYSGEIHCMFYIFNNEKMKTFQQSRLFNEKNAPK
ncbi:MAG: hypothetical protein ACXVJG_15880 [Mucilaginibacter sp.]